MKKIMRKRLKGMTLVEIIIALCVFTIMATAMATCASSASKMAISDARFRNKMNDQGPVIDNRRTQDTITTTVSGVTVGFDGITKSYSGEHTVGDETITNSENGLNFSYFIINNSAP